MYADDDSPDFRKRGGNFAKVRAADLHLQEEHGQRVQQTRLLDGPEPAGSGL